MFGLQQVIEVGPMSGVSNVTWWLEKRGYPAREDLVQAIFQAAKTSARVLTEAEIREICAHHGVAAAGR
jgi:2-isopropylmalate synthase